MQQCLSMYLKIVRLPSVACAKVDAHNNVLIIQGYRYSDDLLNNSLLVDLEAIGLSEEHAASIKLKSQSDNMLKGDRTTEWLDSVSHEFPSHSIDRY